MDFLLSRIHPRKNVSASAALVAPSLASPFGRTLCLTHQMLTSWRRESFDYTCHGDPAGVTPRSGPSEPSVAGNKATNLESSVWM